MAGLLSQHGFVFGDRVFGMARLLQQGAQVIARIGVVRFRR